jgi:hypothetical protein
MFSTSIDKILKADKFSRPFFKGVYARDQLPSLNKNDCIILNNQNKNQAGEHWLAIFVENGFGSFFDSYGNHPSRYNLVDYLNSNTLNWNYNSIRIQGESKYCGLYCVLFILFKSRGLLNKFYSYFSENYDLNDKLIKELVEKHK